MRNWLVKMFQSSEQNSLGKHPMCDPVSPTSPSIVAQPPSQPGLHWYVASDVKKNVRQVVLEIPPSTLTKSRFATLILGAKYSSLLGSDWTTGFFRLDGDPGPFLLVRARNEHRTMESHATRLAFSFYRMRSAGIVAMFWDCPDALGKWPYGHVEGASTTDQPLGLDIIRDGMQKSHLEITFAIHSLRTSADYGGQPVSIPEAISDVSIELPNAFRMQVLRELDDLCNYQRGLSGQGNGGDAMRQMWADNPTDRSAILARSV